jgi:multidrug efflux pump subunit AcrB
VLNELAPGHELIDVVYRSVGSRADQIGILGDVASHVGEVMVELLPTEERQPLAERLGVSLHSEELIRRWRQAVGTFPGIESLAFSGISHGPGGRTIEFKLVGQDLEQLRRASKKIREELSSRTGVFDVADDNRLGKSEIRLRKFPSAQGLNVTEQDLYQDVRARFYGHEVMRLQRGRHEVKLMVRNPPEERRSWGNFLDIRVPLADGRRVPITELAELEERRPYMEINRLEQQRSITVFADVDTDLAGTTADTIVSELKQNAVPALLAEFPGVGIRWEGQRQERDDSLASMAYGFTAALFGMYLLLTLEFRSYVQPLILMMAIPCGFVGAVVGHVVMGLPFTIFSMFGLVTLAGIVVNDAIVLLDFINHRVRGGTPVKQALIEAGGQRFRPVFLTTITTVIGLTPIVLERSVQAQVVIPMAVTLAFGQAMSMIWVLILVPVLYSLYAGGQSFTRRFRMETRRTYSQLGAAISARFSSSMFAPGKGGSPTIRRHDLTIEPVPSVEGNGEPSPAGPLATSAKGNPPELNG